jgi:hypothetical protein
MASAKLLTEPAGNKGRGMAAILVVELTSPLNTLRKSAEGPVADASRSERPCLEFDMVLRELCGAEVAALCWLLDCCRKGDSRTAKFRQKFQMFSQLR